jgi:plasmid stabilization system protein ParE
MAKPVVLTPVSEQDLEHITDYLVANWDKKVCDQFLARFEKVCELISANPKLFPVIHKKKNIRKCVMTEQNVFYYRESRYQIEVITIFDTRQDPDKLFSILKNH